MRHGRGVQALRNFADVTEFASVVYAKPEYIDTLATSTPASAHVKVDYELPGCPIDRGQLLDTLAALLIGRKPRIPAKTVCTECKHHGVTCLVVAEGFRASARSPTRVVGHCAHGITAAAMAVSARPRRPEPRR